jgi:hypothetical protein
MPPNVTKDTRFTADLAADLLWGVDGDFGIAKFLGIDTRKCYYLVSRGEIPITKLGRRTIVASRTELRALFQNNR